MQQASGMLIFSPRGLLLLNRADGGGWCQPGGMMEAGESPGQAACREILEETGFRYHGEALDLILLGRMPDGAVVLLADPFTPQFDPGIDLLYNLFVGLVREEFVPVLNDEHTAFVWTNEPWAYRLHPGTALALKELL